MSKLENKADVGETNAIVAETAEVTGDRGNPHYAKELEDLAKESERREHVADLKGAIENIVESKISGQIMEKPEDTVRKDEIKQAKAEQQPIVKATISPVTTVKHELELEKSKASITGDKGNLYYAEELMKASSSQKDVQPKEDEQVKQEDVTNVGSSKTGPEKQQGSTEMNDKGKESSAKEMMQPVVKEVNTAITGDKGNIHYAKELESTGDMMPPRQEKEEVVQKTNVSSVSAPPPGKGQDIAKSMAQVTGDKGNLDYAKQLEVLSTNSTAESVPNVIQEDVIKVESAAMTNTMALKQETVKSQKPDAIQAAAAKVTGDKGNVDYAKQLEILSDEVKPHSTAPDIVKQDVTKVDNVPLTKAEAPKLTQESKKVDEKETVIKTEAAAITGDKGNIHYAEELEALISSENKPSSDRQQEIQVQRVSVMETSASLPEGNGKGISKETGKASEPVIKYEHSAICGDKGNVHYAQDLERLSTEGEIQAQSVTTVESGVPGTKEKDIRKESKGKEETQGDLKIMEKQAAITGDKGNVDYAKQLETFAVSLEKDERSEQQSQEEIKVESVTSMKASASPIGQQSKDEKSSKQDKEEPVIDAGKAFVTGDKGNVPYAKELEALSGKMDEEQDKIKVETVAGVTSGVKGKDDKNTSESVEQKKKALIKAEQASVTGDRGNIDYAKELKVLSEEMSDPKKQGEEIKAEAVPMASAAAGTKGPKADAKEDVKNLKKTNETEIKAEHTSVCGDKGNVDYAEQLEDLTVHNEQVKAECVLNVQAAKPGTTTKTSDDIKPASDPVVHAIHTAVCGDKGNVHYAKELEAMRTDSNAEKSGILQKGEEIKSESIEVTKTSAIMTGTKAPDVKPESDKADTVLKPTHASVTGDKGNVHYAKDLEASGQGQDMLEVIKVESTSSTKASILAQKDVGDRKASEKGKTQAESDITKAHANVTGDKGNVDDAEALQELSEEVKGINTPDKDRKEEIRLVKDVSAINASVRQTGKGKLSEPDLTKTEARVTGDKGNVHYAEELEAFSKEDSDTKTQNKQEIIQAETIAKTSVAVTGKGNMVQPEVVATEAKITGDKGNVHYAKDLEDSPKIFTDTKTENKQEVTQAESAPLSKQTAPVTARGKASEPETIQSEASVTGDKGNVHYAQELEALSKHVKDTVTQGEQDVIQADSIPMAKSSVPATGKGKVVETEVTSTEARVTGDKGNVHYTKELEVLSKEVTDTKTENEQDIIQAESAPVSKTAVPVTGKGKVVEPEVTSTEARVTGDKGNVHYTKELEVLSKEVTDTKTESEQQIIQAESAPVSKTAVPATGKGKGVEPEVTSTESRVTGDKGNVHYTKELEASSKEVTDTKTENEQQIIQAESAPVSKTAIPVTAKGKADETKVTHSEASMTGDKGNIHYAAELEKMADHQDCEEKKKGKEEPVTEVQAHITGDRGNVDYGKELEEKSGKKSQKVKDKGKDESGKVEMVDAKDDKVASNSGKMEVKDCKKEVESKSDVNMNLSVKENQNKEKKGDKTDIVVAEVSLEDVTPAVMDEKSNKKSSKK